MDKGDLELGGVAMIEKSVQSIIGRIKNEHKETSYRFLPTICMVPRALRDLSPSSFSPRMVSIGPLHRDDENVQAFEERKSSYLVSLMRRMDSPQEEILKLCMEKAYASMERIKECYVWTKEYSDSEIAEMMVMDACFILEFIYHYKRPLCDELNPGYMLLPKTIIYDLVLLENQIPLFFLDKIYECTMLKSQPHYSLVDFIEPVLNDLNLFKGRIQTYETVRHYKTNILSLLHESYTPQIFLTTSPYSSPIHSAADLDRAGVKFEPSGDPTWAMRMKVDFRYSCGIGCWGKPTLRIPQLHVDDFTELVLRNLIAYEQLCEYIGYIQSYAKAMDMLVNTQEDVAKLVQSKVIVNNMGSNEEAANMINNICKELVWTTFIYEEEWRTLDKYYNGNWPKYIAWLRVTYFNSPWNIIALFAGIILFILTVVQTFFTIKPVGSN